uniref:Uncharacterized protein n=1 Tax=Magallana gigas TaxID=29159 RepID=A0A8W8NYN8_MAGGI
MWLWIVLALSLGVKGDLDQWCKTQGTVVKCDRLKENVTCHDEGDKLVRAERLLLMSPRMAILKITPKCLPWLQMIEVRGTNLLNCSHFKGFPLVIINRRICDASKAPSSRKARLLVFLSRLCLMFLQASLSQEYGCKMRPSSAFSSLYVSLLLDFSRPKTIFFFSIVQFLFPAA